MIIEFKMIAIELTSVEALHDVRKFTDTQPERVI